MLVAIDKRGKGTLEEFQGKEKDLQHWVFPGGHPSKYLTSPMLLNFGDQTRTGAFSMVWP